MEIKMKLNHITDAAKILLFAATIIITCIIVSLGFQAADAAKDISSSAVRQIEELNGDIQNGDINRFDHAEVYGSDVMNFIKKHLGDFSDTETGAIFVTVKTSLSENTYTNNSYFSEMKDFTTTKYIKPTALFIGSVLMNDNKVILGISFTQK
jgi:hypothetical protein